MPSNFDFITNYGSLGSGDENLNSLRGFDYNDNHIFIADKDNHRILKWRLSGGSFVAKLGGSSGNGNDEFTYPRDILRVNNLLFIVDQFNDRIKIHRVSDLSYVGEFGSFGSGDNNLWAPASITSSGMYLYIVDHGNQRIVKYKTSDLSFISKKAISGAFTQMWFDWYLNVVLVVDTTSRSVKIYDADSLSLLDTLDETKSIDGAFVNLEGVCVSNHYIYLLEEHRIQVFDESNLAYIASVGSDGSGDSNIASGNYIKPYKNALIFSDSSNHRINIWYDYNPRRAFVSRGTKVISGFQFQQPTIPFDTKQEGVDVTIGGTEDSDKWQWIEEDPQEDSVAWDRE